MTLSVAFHPTLGNNQDSGDPTRPWPWLWPSVLSSHHFPLCLTFSRHSLALGSTLLSCCCVTHYPKTVIKTKTIHYLTEFPWLRNLGVASLSSGGSRSLRRLQSRWQLGLPSAKKTWRAGGPASKHTQLAVGWRPRFITTWTPPLGSSQHSFPSSEIQLRERTLEKTPTQAFCDLVFKSLLLLPHSLLLSSKSSPQGCEAQEAGVTLMEAGDCRTLALAPLWSSHGQLP